MTLLFLPGLITARARSSLVMRVKKSAGIDGYRSLAPLYSPRGPNQKRYVEYLDDPAVSILLGVGPAGTGKTLFACSAAVQEMKRGAIQKIILTRPVVSVEEDIGFLPGSLIAKMDPWTRPIFDILGEFYTQKDVDSMLHSGAIEISPLAYMRGRTFKKSFIIADEMQNSSPNQMLMLTTRLGQSSKMVITGDLKQSDRMTNNGLLDIMNKLKVYQGDSSSIKVVEMGLEDVERSAVVSKILDIYRDPDPLSSVNAAPSSVTPSSDFESSLPLKANFGLNNDCALIPLKYFKGT
jgi:phosphate starvation-inducible PhoH-like protein